VRARRHRVPVACYGRHGGRPLQGGWKSFGWTFGLLVVFVVTLGAGLLSGAFTWGHYFDQGHLLALGEGELQLWLLTNRGADDLGLEDVFADYYFPRPWPAEGLMRNPAFDLCWRWPAMCMESHCGVGTWWEIRVPVWTMLVGPGAVVGLRLIRVSRRRRLSSASKPSAAALVPFARPPWSRSARRTLALSLATTGVLAGLWLTSVSYWIAYSDGAQVVEIDRCACIVRTTADAEFVTTEADEPGWQWGAQHPVELHWELPHTALCVMTCVGVWSELVLPFWMLLGLSAAPAVVLLWHHRRRRRPGYCRQCGYNLTGNASGKCPECGTPVGGSRQVAPAAADWTCPAGSSSGTEA
jgi:hypothetical protein